MVTVPVWHGVRLHDLVTHVDSQLKKDIELGRASLAGRTFLLGNKRAFSLSLPAASGTSDALLHPHKWFGAYLYGRKFLEAQVVRAFGQNEHFLSYRQQSGLILGLTGARRDYQVEGRPCSEEFFVPDGVQGFACTLTGDVEFGVEPELDMRFYRALNSTTDTYEVEISEHGAVISNALPGGVYDDVTETFHPGDADDEVSRLYAALEVVGEGAWVELLPARQRSRRKLFRKDHHRQRFLEHSAPGEAKHDHAPLWDQSGTYVYAPIRLHLRSHGTVIYGFGASREEAVAQLDALRENLIAFQVQKSETAQEIVSRAQFETGDPRTDAAYAHVLSRLMDALVARHAVAEDTALERPATMILAGNQYFHDSWKRDENIALGFLLALGFYDLARDVVRDTWQLQDDVTGRLPQRIRAGEDPPYHSSDGTLWALWRLYQYWRCTGDEALLHEKLPMVQCFFRRSLERAVGGMLPSGYGEHFRWETWMDTPHTPRDGFPVEIQMLWIACLRVFRPVMQSLDPQLECRMQEAEMLAWEALQRFNVRGIPADSLDGELTVRDLITPNPYFCFGVGLDLGPEMERTMREVARRQLAGQQGILTLAPQDWERVFSPEFLSNRRHVRGKRMRSIGKYNYHRGVEWNWLSQFFVQGELKYGEPDIAYRKYLRGQVDAALDRGGIGGIGEIFDLSGTRGPDYQAWSMSGFLESLHAFAGVRIDVPQQVIVIEPQIPNAWPKLAVRKWYGSVPFDLRYAHDDSTRSLSIDFPWGDAPACELEIRLPLPAHRTVGFVDVRLNGESLGPAWRLEPLTGTDRWRLLMSIPACGTVEVTLGLKRPTHRMLATA